MYTIGEASARSGVSVPLIRAWERRYGVVSPQRTPAGYRLYDDEAVARLRAVRTHVESGWAARQAAAHVAGLPSEAMVTVAASPDTATRGGVADSTEIETWVRRFGDAARQLDPDGAGRVLDEAYAATSFETATDRIVLPALVAVGEAWSRGELGVAAEHAASSAVLRRLGAAFDAAGRSTGGAVVLVGMPEGSLHEIAALAFATAARRIGLDAIYMGASVPAASWQAAVDGTAARAVVTGAVIDGDVRAATHALTALRRERPETILALGGPRAAQVQVPGVLRLPEGIAAAARAVRDAIALERRTGRQPGRGPA